MAIFRFFKMAAAAILDFQNFKFLTAGMVKGSNCTSTPNFVKIGSTAAKIWRFFKMAAAAILDFRNFTFLTVGPYGQEGRTTSPRQIWLKSAKTRPRYRDLSIFPDGSAAILDFKNFKFLTVGRSGGSNCIIMPNFVKIAACDG